MSPAATRIEQSIEIRADAERVFGILIDPNYMPHYAARIESAEILHPGPDGAKIGTRLQLGTTGGKTLEATIKDYRPGRILEIEDENGLTSRWSVEPAGPGKVRLTNTLLGNLDKTRENRLRYDVDLKFQTIATTLEAEAAAEPRHSTGGHSNISGTAQTPK